MNIEQKKQLVAYLSSCLSEARITRMRAVAAQRTRHITIVLEDIYQSHNISAALRSAEAFGLCDAHIIEQQHRYSVNINVTKGASEWIELHRYREQDKNNTESCYAALRARGYRIVATAPSAPCAALRSSTGAKHGPLHDLPITQPLALIFGTEETGLSQYALDHADELVTIPMVGFTGSLNISVSVAVCLYDVTNRLRNPRPPILSQFTLSSVEGKCEAETHEAVQRCLPEEAQLDLQLMWLRKTVRGAQELEERFLKDSL